MGETAEGGLKKVEWSVHTDRQTMGMGMRHGRRLLFAIPGIFIPGMRVPVLMTFIMALSSTLGMKMPMATSMLVINLERENWPNSVNQYNGNSQKGAENTPNGNTYEHQIGSEGIEASRSVKSILNAWRKGVPGKSN